MSFTVHTTDTAPAGAKEQLEASRKAYGFVPNLHAVMAESPELLAAYKQLSELFDKTSFSPAERQTVLLTVSYENGCEYCVGAHSAIAGMQKVPEDVIQALRDGKPIADPKLEALRRFTAVQVLKRGWPSQEDIAAFLGAGYGKAQILEVILAVGYKTMSNYTNHVAATPLDDAFAAAAWKKAG